MNDPDLMRSVKEKTAWVDLALTLKPRWQVKHTPKPVAQLFV